MASIWKVGVMASIWKVIIVLVVCAFAYAIVLQATGQTAQAEHFVTWAGGGLITLVVGVWLLHGGNR